MARQARLAYSCAPAARVPSLQNAMADTATPNVIRRADYAPPAFLIDTVALEFDLLPERTVVKNTMRVRLCPSDKNVFVIGNGSATKVVNSKAMARSESDSVSNTGKSIAWKSAFASALSSLNVWLGGVSK